MLFLPDFETAWTSFHFKFRCNVEDFRHYYTIAEKRNLPQLILEDKLGPGDKIFLEKNPDFVIFLAHCLEVEFAEYPDTLVEQVQLAYLTIPSYICWGLLEPTIALWHRLTPAYRTQMIVLALECQQLELFHQLVHREEDYDAVALVKRLSIDQPGGISFLLVKAISNFEIDLAPILDRIVITEDVGLNLLTTNHPQVTASVLHSGIDLTFSKQQFDALSSEVQAQIIQHAPTSANLKHYARQIHNDRTLNAIPFFHQNHTALEIFLDHLRDTYYDHSYNQLGVRDKYSHWINFLLEKAGSVTTQIILQRVHRDEYKTGHGYAKRCVAIWRPVQRSI